MIKKKIAIGLSGGVDSAVAANLLKENKDYEVIGVFMQNWDDYLGEQSNNACSWVEDWNDAQQIAKQLEIPLYKVSFVKEYWEEVFAKFLSELKQGFTPNPDIWCNRIIKFNYFIKYVEEKLGANYIATGHYAKIMFKNSNYYLAEAKDKFKDQTYFICQINSQVLSKLIFPLADLTKKEVREIAEEKKLINASRS